jgi:hypothetical protein
MVRQHFAGVRAAKQLLHVGMPPIWLQVLVCAASRS